MSFSINFTDSPIFYPFDDLSTAAKEGFLEMEGGREYFISSLYEWTVDDYFCQWREALTQLVDGEEKVGLITSYIGPENSSHLNWWPLYRCNDMVVIQNQILFYSQLPGAFSLENLHSYILPRVIDDSTESVASEWVVSILDVHNFLNKIKK